MNICIVGLGLIGGSFAKAISKNTSHTVFGIDIDAKTIDKAKNCGAIDDGIVCIDGICNMSGYDLIIVALTPKLTIDFIKTNAGSILRSTVVVDCCGIKSEVCKQLSPIAKESGFTFIGGHPMAGKELSSFSHSTQHLFDNASMILTPVSDTEKKCADQLKSFFFALGFKDIVISTPKQHDEIIAYTSQLAHITSNAYIKSPTAQKHRGFSAGSFRDLTRVAYLDENMWSELFLLNKDNLLYELNFLMDRLNEYKQALTTNNQNQLTSLLRDGKEKKQCSMAERTQL